MYSRPLLSTSSLLTEGRALKSNVSNVLGPGNLAALSRLSGSSLPVQQLTKPVFSAKRAHNSLPSMDLSVAGNACY